MALFNNIHTFNVIEHQTEELRKSILNHNGDKILNTSTVDLVNFCVNKYCVDVPVLDIDNITVAQEEADVNVSNDFGRDIRDRSKPFLVKGLRIKVEIPYSGDGGVFGIIPSSSVYPPINAETRMDKIYFEIVGKNLNATEVQSNIQNRANKISQHLETLRKDFRSYNMSLESKAQQLIEKRKSKLLADKNLVGQLGFKIKQRNDASSTYVTSDVRKKIRPVLPKASKEPFQPEPVLSVDHYNEILEILTNMTLVMERSPVAFNGMDEEGIRTHFLVQLNGRYEGQATGETFNYEGKTDILVKSDGKNIFVAECKIWRGQKELLEAIDQILKYLSWRDTKTALLIFNRNRSLTNVLNAISETVPTHANFKRYVKQRTETSWEYLFSHKDDSNRELTLTVMAFDIPKEKSSD